MPSEPGPSETTARVDVWVVADWTGPTDSLLRRVVAPYPARGGAISTSVSHTEGMTLVAVGRGHRVGVDVEVLRDRGVRRLPEHALSSSEVRELERFGAATRLPAFLSYWVRKEALLKAVGVGLAVEPARIELPPPGCGSLTSAPAAFEPVEQWCIRELELEGYAAAVAADETIDLAVRVIADAI